MDNKEILNYLNLILSEKEIDERAKPLIKLFAFGKWKTNILSIEELQNQVDILCGEIKNVEFLSSDKIITAYENKAKILTVNKQLFLEGKSDEAILPVFMKMEEALNHNKRNTYGNHIEDFITAGRTAKAISMPISNRLNKLYEMAECCYSNEKQQYTIEEQNNDRSICSKYNYALNNMIITGTDDQRSLLEGARLFHSEIFPEENIDHAYFETEEYQEKAAKILACIDTIKPKKIDNSDYYNEEIKSLVNNIKLYTGCTEDKVQEAISDRYIGDDRITSNIETTFKETPVEISEKFIQESVKAVLSEKPNYDSKIKHLLIPFFIRSQKLYNWNKDEFLERLNQVNLKIDKIKFEDLGNIVKIANTGIDKILLNSRIFLDKNANIQNESYLVPTLFHELGHDTDENGREGISTKDMLQKNASQIGKRRFYEWTNTVFERLVSGGKFYKQDNAMELAHSGYEALGPLGSMLSCALGVDEIEFAKIKDKGKDYEEQFFENMFINKEQLEKIKKIFDSYYLETGMSFSKKRHNQNLLNEFYAESLDIMKERMKRQLENNDIQDLEQYKKHQMFYLKKMNVNFKNASKENRVIFSRTPITHDIGFCNDKIAKKDEREIAKQAVTNTDFGFNNKEINQYSTNIMQKKDRKALSKIFVLNKPKTVKREPPQHKEETEYSEENSER